MSSENEDSFEKLFSTRAAMKVPAPWRRVTRPSSARASRAVRTVICETPNSYGDVALGGQGLVGGQAVIGYGLAQGALELLIERPASLFIQSADHFRQGRHDALPLSSKLSGPTTTCDPCATVAA